VGKDTNFNAKKQAKEGKKIGKAGKKQRLWRKSMAVSEIVRIFADELKTI
jgi:hypothetical protein